MRYSTKFAKIRIRRQQSVFQKHSKINKGAHPSICNHYVKTNVPKISSVLFALLYVTDAFP